MTLTLRRIIMKFLSKTLLSTALVAGMFSGFSMVNSAQAGGAYGDYERGVTCKQLRRSGALQWYSVASGTINTGGGRSGYSGFVTKACHTNRSSCQRWVDRVAHEIGNLDTLETAYCQRAK